MLTVLTVKKWFNSPCFLTAIVCYTVRTVRETIEIEKQRELNQRFDAPKLVEGLLVIQKPFKMSTEVNSITDRPKNLIFQTIIN